MTDWLLDGCLFPDIFARTACVAVQGIPFTGQWSYPRHFFMYIVVTRHSRGMGWGVADALRFFHSLLLRHCCYLVLSHTLVYLIFYSSMIPVSVSSQLRFVLGVGLFFVPLANNSCCMHWFKSNTWYIHITCINLADI